jgi:hypothetical protein
VVFREPRLVVKIAGSEDVERATASLVEFALTHAPSLVRFAAVDTLIKMLQDGDAVAASEASLVLVDPHQIAQAADVDERSNDNAQVIAALLVGARRWEEARHFLGDRIPPGRSQSALAHHRRFQRQLTRWVDHDGTLQVPTSPAQWPPDWWETSRQVEQSSGFLQFFVEQWPESRARTEAVNAVRAVSAGKTQNELRALLRDELDKRGVSMEPVSFEQKIDALMTEREPFGRARLLLQGLHALGETGRQGTAILRSLAGDSADCPPKRKDPDWMRTPERASYPLHLIGGERVAVELDSTAGTSLAEVLPADQSGLVQTRRVEVWLASDDVPSSITPSVSVHIGVRRIGCLTGTQVERFRPALEAAAERDEDARVDAHLTHLPSGTPYVLDLPLPADNLHLAASGTPE